MVNNLTSILGDKTLSKEVMESLQEAFDARVAEAKEEAEHNVRAEFSRRYEHDKNQMVEAMDRLMGNVIAEHEEAKNAEIKKFVEARTVARKAIKESRSKYASEYSTKTDMLTKRIKEHFSAKAAELNAQKAKLAEQVNIMAEELAEVKAAMADEHAARLQKIDEFVVRRVTAELKEFAQDKRALVEARVKLASEGRAQLAEMKKRIVEKSAKRAETFINETLKTELSSLHDELERNRENMFGRRVFEAVANEFMSSYFIEGTKVGELQKVLESTTNELRATKQKLDEAAKNTTAAQRKAQLAESRERRNKVMNELMSNLRGDKRAVMESMLETTKTAELRDAFNKLLPVVMNEARKPAPKGKTTLNENKKETQRYSTVKTGNRAKAILEESTDPLVDSELEKIVRLSGIKK